MAEAKEFPTLSSEEYNQAEGITPEVEQAHDNPEVRKQQPSLEAVIGSLELMAEATLPQEATERQPENDPEVEAGMVALIDGIDKVITHLDEVLKNATGPVVDKLVEERDGMRVWRADIMERHTSERWRQMSKADKIMVINGALKNIHDY